MSKITRAKGAAGVAQVVESAKSSVQTPVLPKPKPKSNLSIG
jgi:hypothetical protein